MAKLSTDGSPYKLVNVSTGETFDIELKQARSLREEWTKLFLQFAEWLARSPLSGATVRVLLFLVSKTGYGNTVALTPSSVAKELGMRPSNVSRAFRELRERDVLQKGAKGEILNPMLVWRGSDRKRQTVIGAAGAGRKAELPDSLPVQPRLSLK